MNPWHGTLRGMVAMTAAASAFTLADGLTKLADLPTGETMVFRSGIAALFLGGVLIVTRTVGDLARLGNRLVATRTVADVVATVFYLAGLFQIPLSNALTIVQVTPLAMTGAAALFLGEYVGWHRWTAVLVGFAGVLVVVRPGLSGFEAGSLLIVASVAAITVRDLSSRYLPPISGAAVSFVAMVAITVVGFAIGFTETWRVPSLAAFSAIVGGAIFLALGHIAVIVAMRAGEMSAIAPFRYVAIPLAIIFGFIAWGVVPDAITLIGTALIIAAGVYAFARERTVARRRHPPGPA